MESTDNIILVIPARAGSKRLPEKNRTLVPYTLDTVADLKWPENMVILSTDDITLIQKAQEEGWPCRVHVRPDYLAGDGTTMAESIEDMADTMGLKDNDIIVLLQPTSPLRTARDIAAAIKAYLSQTKRNGRESLVSVCKVMENPATIVDLDSGGRPVTNKSGNFYFINGAIYINSVEFLRRNKSFYVPGKSELFLMPKSRSIDVNDIEDIEMVKMLMRGKQHG